MPRFASVILVDPAGRILMQERDEHPLIDPECWGLPGGHVEDGEGDEAAARRELAEETGVELAPGELSLFGAFEVWHEAYGSLDPFTAYAAATRLGDDDVECHEGRRMVFVDAERIPRLPLTGSARIALTAFLQSDHYRHLIRELSTP